MSVQASLEVIEGARVRELRLSDEGLTIGRAPDNDVVLSAASISSHHAELHWRGDDLVVNDLGSSYGTRRDGRRLEVPTILRDGDEIVLGGAVVLRLTLEGARFGAPATQLMSGDSGLIEADLTQGVEPLALDLLPVVESLHQASSLEELGARVVGAVGERFGPSRVALIELEPTTDRFRVLGLHNASRLDRRPLRDASFVSRTVVEAAVLRGVAFYREGGGGAVVASLIRSGAHCAVAASIRPANGRVCVLYMDATMSEPPFSDGHAVALELFAAHATAAFDGLSRRQTQAENQLRFEQLRRYFSPAVVEHLLVGDAQLVDRPRMVDATVLFADLVDYTSMSEQLKGDPNALLDLLNLWLDAGARAALAHTGTLDKFIGDCVMVIFGAPFPLENEELLAVRCCLQMMVEIDRISEQIGKSLEITVGINSGAMLAGSVGSRRRLEYTVLGDTVNVAARLQGAARPGEILVGHETYERLAGKVRFEDAGSFTPKNLAPIQTYRVKGLVP